MVTKLENDCLREKAVKEAVDAVYRIILDASDGSEEETNYLTAAVAERLMQTALLPFSAAILKKDLDDQISGKLT
ncbi:MAG: hypothetical protein WC511_07895 [Candidatus Pacearchaeota archaeon]|jgi:hypothetical protein